MSFHPDGFQKSDPLIVEVTRGTMVESLHRVHVAVMNAKGELVFGWGDVARIIFPRSAIKPLQALPFLETGAADALRLNDERVALACASHSSGQAHVMTVEAWLNELGFHESDLACGPHLPYDEEAAHAMLRRGEAPTRLHNNCSGKHSGFLSTMKHLGEDPDGYLAIDHPLQKRLYEVLSEMGETDMTGTGRGVDGCGIPVYGMPLSAMALGMAKLADPSGLGPVRAAAAKRIVHSMAKHNYMVAGRARFDTAAMSVGVNVAKRTGAAPFATKTGAEAVHAGILPDQGLGIALKAEDGNKRASDTAMANVLAFLGALDDDGKAELNGWINPVVTNWEGTVIGGCRARTGWDVP